MKDLKGIVFGIANERSIAWGIARALHEAGAQLAVTYLNESLEKRVRPLAEEIGARLVGPCDVCRDDEIDQVFEATRSELGRLDFLVHSIAYASRDALKGSFLETSRADFLQALEISAYSLTALARRASPLMEGGEGSIITLTYAGSERVFPSYNVMGVAKAALEASVRYLASDLGPRGIRVNAISPGPIKTLSAAGIRGFSSILEHNEARAPLRRNVTIEEVGSLACFLLGPHSRGITGEVIYVDSGYHILGM